MLARNSPRGNSEDFRENKDQLKFNRKRDFSTQTGSFSLTFILLMETSQFPVGVSWRRRCDAAQRENTMTSGQSAVEKSSCGLQSVWRNPLLHSSPQMGAVTNLWLTYGCRLAHVSPGRRLVGPVTQQECQHADRTVSVTFGSPRRQSVPLSSFWGDFCLRRFLAHGRQRSSRKLEKSVREALCHFSGQIPATNSGQSGEVLHHCGAFCAVSVSV